MNLMLNKVYLNVWQVDLNGDDFGSTSRVRVEDDDAVGLVGVVDRQNRFLRKRIVMIAEIILNKTKTIQSLT